jgi:hypothetical protein
MSVDGFYEVFVLLDHASDLMVRDESISGAAALDIAAGHAIASDLAAGVAESPVELPSSVAGCLEQAERVVMRWEPAELSTEALVLVVIVLELRLELCRA